MNATSRQHQDDELIQKLTQIVLDNLNNEQFGVTELSKQFGMNRSQLYRRVLVLTKKSLSQFIREIRLTEALNLLIKERVTVSEAAYRVGFKNPSYFNSCFHDHYGFPPGEAKHVNLEDALRNSMRKKSPDKHRFSFAKKYAFLTIFFILVIVSTATVLFLKRDKDSIEDKSIAVLPFTSLSDDPEKQYLADGVMDAILLHLSKIEDLRVMAGTSVEQYRETDKTATMICQELNVAYLLEGSFQKYGDQARLIVQLIKPGIEGYIWANEYDRDWKDIFSVQSEVAQTVAGELQAVITPEEKQLIEKVPTVSLTAYDFYQRGRDEHEKYWFDRDAREALERAEVLFYKALEYDSTFALAYVGLANVYRRKHYWKTYVEEDFLDSVQVLADIALSYDDQLAEAYTLKGEYYRTIGLIDQAIEEYDKAIKLNPNDWEAYRGKGRMYFFGYNDFVKAIDNSQKAASLNHGNELPYLLKEITWPYCYAGFFEKGKFFLAEALKLDNDSFAYYTLLSSIESSLGNYEKAIEFGQKGYALDSNNIYISIYLANYYTFFGQYEEAFKYSKKCAERVNALGQEQIAYNYNNLHRIGYIYWQNGYKDEAEYYFNEQIDVCNRMNELGRLYSHYDLAGVYAFRGEKDKAYENLRVFNQNQIEGFWVVTLINDDPLFDSIRDEPEFQQIVRDVEAKYQAEHERVRKWLEENEML